MVFDVSRASDAEADIASFLDTIDALIMGSTIYEWLLGALDKPEDLTTSYGQRPIPGSSPPGISQCMREPTCG
ncbi:hypothetical protein [uncultured Corynebacterium sp.]|uniref:hypothetical protein n=1 Tax=uncultured Corynebacterium sp. TaxID=159447 RepID=UPI0025FEE4E1|nr:hypothetical protein [uncultured Corynebacterium sp.]